MNENDLLLLARLIQIITALAVKQAEQAGMTEDELFARAKAKFVVNEDQMDKFLDTLDGEQ